MIEIDTPNPKKAKHLPPGRPDEFSPEDEALSQPVPDEEQVVRSGILGADSTRDFDEEE